MRTILIACGGTGGHVAPGIALAQGLRERGYRCLLVVSRKQVDARLMRRYPELEYVQAPGVGWTGGLLGLPRFAWKQMRSVVFNMSLMRRYKPDICIAFGGFLSLGTFVASKLYGIPFALHEANRKPGKAVRLLQKGVDRLYLPEGVRDTLGSHVRTAGYPVRQDLQREDRHKACKALGLDPQKPVLVVLGGSQGAQALNTWAREHAEVFALKGIQLYCVMGTRNLDNETSITHLSEDGAPIVCRFVPFTDSMGTVLSCADLVVSRSGAGAIAEITRCQVPAFYIPFPYAADNHQKVNAAYAVSQGLGWMLCQKNLNRLSSMILEYFKNPKKQERCQQYLAQAAQEDTLQDLIKDLEALMPPRLVCQGT